jgi:hypothetical protein
MSEDATIPKDFLPCLTWPNFFYKQQVEFTNSKAWQVWYIAGNGTGKTLCVYLNGVAHLLGIHHNALGKPPIKIKCLVPSFDSVEDVALEKLLENQRIVLAKDEKGITKLSPKHEKWIEFLKEHNALVDSNIPGGWIEIGPILPHSMIVPKKSYTKEHRGIELKNGSSIWWVTSEQGWMAQRGSEQDIVLIDEEGDERVTDECVRGLRNAKGGGKVIAGMTPPYEPGAGPTWTKEKIVEASLKDTDIHVINACMAENPAIDAEFIDRFSRGKTQKQIDIQIYGKYPNWGDMVHPDFQDRIFDVKKLDGSLLSNDTELPENWEVDWVMAFDWHPSKPCAAVFGYVDSDGNLTIFDELDKDVAEGKDIGELANIFKSIEGFPHHRRQFRRWQDPSAQHDYNAVKRGFNAWDAFRKEGIVTAAGKNRDPEVGISITNEYFKGNMKDHPRLFVYERCKNLRNALSNHYWKRGPDGKGKPDPKWSDYPICVRYIAQEMGWNIKNKRRTGRLPLVSYEKADVMKRTFRLDRLVA